MSNYLPNGISKKCINPSHGVKNIIITDVELNFTLAKLLTVDALETALQVYAEAGGRAYVPHGLSEWLNITGEDTREDLAIGRAMVTGKSAPSYTASIESNWNDFKSVLNNLEGCLYRVIFVLENGDLFLNVDNAGKYKGFLCRLQATSMVGVQVDQRATAYKIHIDSIHRDEFEKLGVQVKPNYNPLIELPLLMPIGVDVYNVSGNVGVESGSIELSMRSKDTGAPYTAGTAIADWVLVNQGFKNEDIGDPFEVAAITHANGGYVLTIANVAEDPVIVGDWVDVMYRDSGVSSDVIRVVFE